MVHHVSLRDHELARSVFWKSSAPAPLLVTTGAGGGEEEGILKALKGVVKKHQEVWMPPRKRMRQAPNESDSTAEPLTPPYHVAVA
jgi:hypothetical protein